MSAWADKPLEIIRGDTFVQPFTFPNFDLTGFSLRMQIRTDATSSRIYGDFSTDNGKIVVTNIANGMSVDSTATITISSEDSAKLPIGSDGEGSLKYDIEFKTGDVVNTYIIGDFTVIGDITR